MDVIDKYTLLMELLTFQSKYPIMGISTVPELVAYKNFDAHVNQRFSYVKYCGYKVLPLTRILPEELVRIVSAFTV